MESIEHEESKDAPQKSTKEELIANIREWIKTDNEIIKLSNEVKEKKKKMKGLNDSLINIMKGNNIDCFDINGGALIYKQKKTVKPISRKFLLSELQKYYKEQPEMALNVANHLLDNREVSVKDEIKRKINKEKEKNT
jgi:hypothetical protein